MRRRVFGGSCSSLTGHGRTLVNFFFYLLLQTMTTISHSNATISDGQRTGDCDICFSSKNAPNLNLRQRYCNFTSPVTKTTHLFCLLSRIRDTLFQTFSHNSSSSSQLILPQIFSPSSLTLEHSASSHSPEWRLPLVLFIYLTIFFRSWYKTTLLQSNNYFFFYVGWFSLTR